jgi:hypothetical protein
LDLSEDAKRASHLFRVGQKITATVQAEDLNNQGLDDSFNHLNDSVVSARAIVDANADLRNRNTAVLFGNFIKAIMGLMDSTCELFAAERVKFEVSIPKLTTDVSLAGRLEWLKLMIGVMDCFASILGTVKEDASALSTRFNEIKRLLRPILKDLSRIV